MAIGDGFVGKILVQALGGVIATMFGMVIIVGILYVIAIYGVAPYVQNHINLPQWIVDLIDKLL